MAHRGNVVCLAGLLAWGWAAPGWGQEPEAFASPTPPTPSAAGSTWTGHRFQRHPGRHPANLSSTVWGPATWTPASGSRSWKGRPARPRAAPGRPGRLRHCRVGEPGPGAGGEPLAHGGVRRGGGRPLRPPSLAGLPPGARGHLHRRLEATRTSRPWDELDPSSKFNGLSASGAKRATGLERHRPRHPGERRRGAPTAAGGRGRGRVARGGRPAHPAAIAGAGLRRENASGVTTGSRCMAGSPP